MKNIYFKTAVILTGLICFQSVTIGQTLNIPPGCGPTISNIIGGVQIDITEAPYQVSLENSGSHFCGGSIISDRWILTAAHCLVGQTASNITVHAGSTDQTNSNVGQRILAQTLYVHPSYNGSTLENDLALIYLSQPLQFNYSVTPIEYANSCNTTTADITAGVSTFLTGWGITCNSCPVAINLQGVFMPIISQSDAMVINQNYDPGNTLNISNNMISFYESGKGAGPGDSGGPAVIDKNGNKVEIGTSSWGYWPKDQLPTVYANVRNYATWIETTTGFSISSTGWDLYSKDNPWDMGTEPNIDNGPMWISEDIWNRTTNNGIANQTYQNPEHGQTNYIYVKVRNRGCTASSGNEKLKVYWAKASTGLGWPTQWVNYTASITGCNATLFGDEITTGAGISIPAIAAGGSTILEIPWTPADPDDYACFGADKAHFCLLARIVDTSLPNDGMTFVETFNVYDNTKNNNNIAWKNVTVVNLGPIVTDPEQTIIRNVSDEPVATKLYFKVPEGESDNSFLNQGTVKIRLNDSLFSKWTAGGSAGQGFDLCTDSSLLITDVNAWIGNITLYANEMQVIETTFELYVIQPDRCQRNFDIIQHGASGNPDSLIGGVRFQLNTCPEYLPSRNAVMNHSNEAEKSNLIAAKFYPNPVSSELIIENVPEGKRIYLYNIHGKLLLETLSKSNTNQLNLASFPSGVYFIKVEGMRTEKIVKF